MTELHTKELTPFDHLDEFLTLFLQNYFKYHPEFPWSETDTKILISKPYSTESQDNDLKPRILVERVTFSLTNPSLVSNKAISGKELKEFFVNNQKLYKAASVYNIKIMGKTIADANKIAQELMVVFLMHSERIKELLQIEIQQHIDASPPIIDVSGTNIDSSITSLTLLCSYLYIAKAKIFPLYPKLEGVDLANEVKNILNNKKLEINKIRYKSES